MLRNIALAASALVFSLFMFFYLLNAPEPPPQTTVVANLPASTIIQPTVVTTSPTAAPAQVQTQAPEAPTATPLPAPVAIETEIARVLEENNRGLTAPVSVSRILDTITVRWALNDRADVVADAEGQIRQALGVIGNEYRLINFEGTFSIVYPDGRKAEEVVLWVTYEDGREVSRKVAPVLTRE